MDTEGAGVRVTASKQRNKPPADEGPSFQPKINPVSVRMLEVSSSVPGDFYRRQRHFDRLREENRASLVATSENNSGCTFTPSPGTATAVLALSDRRFDQLLEEPEQRWERMALREADDRAVRQAAVRAHVARHEGTFAPSLNSRSLKIAEESHVRSVTDPDISRERERRAAQRRAETEARALQDCTFFPNTSKPSVMGYYDEYEPPKPAAPLSVSLVAASEGGIQGLPRRIEERRRQKEKWADAMRATRERREMAECTFAPDTKKAPVAISESPVPVRGMDRFIEVRKMAEKQQAELQARAAKVFMLQPRSPVRLGPTVPKPFKLASEARARTKAAST